MRWYREIDWAGAVAMVLALGISLSLVIGFAGAIIRQTPMSEARAQVLASIFGGVVGAIATYLGMSRSLASVRASSGSPRDEFPTKRTRDEDGKV